MRKIFPRCSCSTKDGTQCGRRVKDGSQPPVCSVHREQQRRQGQPADHHFTAAPFDEIEKLTKIARNDRHPQQLQAIKMLREFKREQPTIDHSHAFVKALSEEERAEMHTLLGALDDFKERIYLREPDLRPGSEMRPIVIPKEEPDHEQDSTRRLDLAVSTPPAVQPAAGEPGRDQGRHRQEVTRDKWRAVGLFEERGFVTHALGDDHAAKILAGEISYEDAVSDQQALLREADEMACGNLRRLP